MNSFASVAEATAHYYERGFVTLFEDTYGTVFDRVMRSGDTFVTIRKVGFLDVKVFVESAWDNV